MNRRVKSDEIQSAFEALEQLDALRGQARNARLQILQQHQGNCVLKTFFSFACDWRLASAGISISTLEIDDQFSGYTSLEQGTRELFALTKKTFSSPVGNVRIRLKLRRLYSEWHPLVRKWGLRMLTRDMRVFVGLNLLRTIWPEDFVLFAVPPSHEPVSDGQRLFIFLDSPIAYTETGRPHQLALELFGRRLHKIQNTGVLEAILRSTTNEWPLIEHILNSHVSSTGFVGLRNLSSKLSLDLVAWHNTKSFEKQNFNGDRQMLSTLTEQVKNIFPNLPVTTTGILDQESQLSRPAALSARSMVL